MKKERIILLIDKYRSNRGGYSRILEVRCENCKNFVCDYQKDGPGPLKRLYTDRVFNSKLIWKKEEIIFCKKCKVWLGLASVYKKENRKCFILFQNSVLKKVKKI